MCVKTKQLNLDFAHIWSKDMKQITFKRVIARFSESEYFSKKKIWAVFDRKLAKLKSEK